MGRYTVALSTGALPAVERSVEVVANRARARLELGRDGAEAFFFANGQPDSLRFRDPVRLGAGGESTELRLRLIDAFENPIEAEVTAEVAGGLGGGERRPDAGAPDASDDAPGDAGDALAADAGTPDAAPESQGEGDKVLVSLGADCDEPSERRAEASTDARGRLRLCLAGGEAMGLAQVAIRVAGVLRVAQAGGEVSDSLRLRTETVPSGQLRLTVEGQPELRCAAGEVTQPLTLRVLDTADPPHPVPGQEVRTSARGLTGVVPEVAVSGADGRLTFRAQCPARRSEQPELAAFLADDPSQQLTFPVEIQVGEVARVSARLLNAEAQAPTLRIGTTGALRLVLFDALGNTVPQGVVSLSLPQVLAGALTLAEPACGAEVGASVSGLDCTASGGGELTLALRAGGVLPGAPVPLRVHGHNAGGDDPVTELAVNLVAGQAAQPTLSPNGRIDAVVGANAGALRVRVSDAGGNPVAGVGAPGAPGRGQRQPRPGQPGQRCGRAGDLAAGAHRRAR